MSKAMGTQKLDPCDSTWLRPHGHKIRVSLYLYVCMYMYIQMYMYLLVFLFFLSPFSPPPSRDAFEMQSGKPLENLSSVGLLIVTRCRDLELRLSEW